MSVVNAKHASALPWTISYFSQVAEQSVECPINHNSEHAPKLFLSPHNPTTEPHHQEGRVHPGASLTWQQKPSLHVPFPPYN